MSETPIAKPIWLRIVQFPLLRLAVLGALLFFAIGFSNLFMSRNAAEPLIALIVAVAMILLALGIYVGFVRLVERRQAAELSLVGMGKELGIGLLIGSALYTSCVMILMLLGIYHIDGLNPISSMLPAASMALSSGFLEELLFRGALFRIVEEWVGSWISLVISAAVFGLVHLMNPTATLTGALYISVEAGLLLAAAYMLTRRLWLSIGFHISWNYTQSGVFSGIVSGGDSRPGLIRATIKGPEALTGGDFGLESSVVAFALCTATGIVLLLMSVRRGHVVALFEASTEDERGTTQIKDEKL